MPVFTPPGIPVIPPVSIADRKNGPPTQQENPRGYALMKYYYNVNSSFRRYRGVNVWKMNDGTYQMSDPVPGVNFVGTINWPYPDTLQPVNNAISSSWFSGGPGPAGALGPDILSSQDSGFEVPLIGSTWTGNAITSAGRVFGPAHTGSWSLLLQAISSGTLGVQLGQSAYTVGSNLSYVVSGWVRAAATPRQWTVGLNFYDANLNFLGAAQPSGGTDVVGNWTQISTVGSPAPSNAAYGQPFFTVAPCATSEQHYLDDVSLSTGGPTAIGGSGPGGFQELVIPGIAIEYLGGHSYTVSAAEKASLTAVGLGAFVV